MSTSTAGTVTAVPGRQLSHRQILSVLAGLMLGMFLAALDQTIVTSAIRTIGDDLHGLSVQAWVTTAYLITATISTPLYGKLSDIYGRKQFFLAAITIFVIGSAACSFATSMYMLAGFRAFQGLGAGGLFSLALAIIADIVPPRERSRYQSYFLAVFGASSVLGPVIGGFFAGADSILGLTGWRWVFLVNVPVGVAALIVVARGLKLQHIPRDHRIDWWGAVTICVCLVPLLTVAEQGRTWGWGSGRSIGCYVVGGAGLVLFLLAEARMKQEALIPLRFFRSPTFSLASAAGFVVGMGMFGGLALLPLYLQIVRGATPTASGLQLLPLTGGLMLGSIISGQTISRTGRYKIFPVTGAALMVIGLALLHFVGVDTPYWRTGLFMAVFGVGLGFILQPITLAVQNAMEPRDIGVATSSVTFFRQMGATAGTAIFLSLLFSTVGDKIQHAYAAAAGTARFQQALADPAVAGDPANQPIIAALNGGGGVGDSALNDTSFLTKVAPVLARPFKDGFSDSMDTIFVVAAVVVVLAFVLLLFLPQLALPAAREQDATSPAERAPAPVPLSNEALVSGRVDGPGALPVAGATVTVTDFAGGQLARAVTGEDGTYDMILPTGGTFLFVCAGPQLQPAASMITVSTGELRRDVSLAGGAQIAGTVTDPRGAAIAGAALTLIDARGEVVATTTSGPSGDYALTGLYPAAYTLTATAGSTRPVARGVRFDEDPSARADLVLVTNATLAGRVLAAASGRPVAEASVMVIDQSGTVAGATVTGADGRYQLADLSPGAYTVTASGYAPVASRVELGGDSIGHDILLGSGNGHRIPRPAPDQDGLDSVGGAR